MWNQVAVVLGMVFLLWPNGAWIEVLSGLFFLLELREAIQRLLGARSAYLGCVAPD